MSDELKFSDLIKPGDAGQQALRRELERRRDIWDRPGYQYRGAGDLILRHGHFWGGRELPEKYTLHRGEESQCFANAMRAAETDPELRYVEGVFSNGSGHFTTHAWCIDPANEVVELTVPTTDPDRYTDASTRMPYMPVVHWSYAGVAFSADLVRFHDIELGLGLPMIDRSRADAEVAGHLVDMTEVHDWPILKVVYDPDRRTLP